MENELRDCRGSVLMETVIVMPVLLLLIFGVIQFAHIWTARQMVAYAAFCATRAVMVVPPDEQEEAAQNAAEVALSWINLVDDKSGKEVTVPGWGKIGGSGLSPESRDDGWNGKRVKVDVVESGKDKEMAVVEVKFRFPLLIPGMAVNKVIANAESQFNERPTTDFYRELNTAAGKPRLIDGWPYIELKETCVLPMPYSTEDFPEGAFDDVNIRRGS